MAVNSAKLKFGTSFSLHRCSELSLDKPAVLRASLDELGFRRYRLMSYWNIHESKPGRYNFDELDWQVEMIEKEKGEITFCLGKRQPRWPECHLPAWAAELPKGEWYQALNDFIETIVKRYQSSPAIVSWQLENEALLKKFGHCPDQDYNRDRLVAELKLVKRLDPNRPVIMTLSDSWGLPWRRPQPDAFGLSLYRTTINSAGQYSYSKRPALFYKLRAALIKALRGKPVFIHELQAEPWLPHSLRKSTIEEQLALMSPEILKTNLDFAVRTGLAPIDLWGLEWWYWLRQQGHPEVWQAVSEALK